MSSRHIYSFSGRVHFNIEYQVACNIFVTNRIMIVPVQIIESDPRVICIFPDGLMPECDAIFLINTQGISNWQVNLYPKLESFIFTPLFYFVHQPVMFLQQFTHPLYKIWFIQVTVGYSMFCRLNWIGFLDKMQGNAIIDLIYIFYLYIPTLFSTYQALNSVNICIFLISCQNSHIFIEIIYYLL